MSRTSFGSSSNSYLSKVGSFKSYNKEEHLPIEGKVQHNPYELNERSFLKNKMKSMTHLFETEHTQNNREEKYVELPSSKSLKELKFEDKYSPPKIKFSYNSSILSSTLPVNSQNKTPSSSNNMNRSIKNDFCSYPRPWTSSNIPNFNSNYLKS